MYGRWRKTPLHHYLTPYIFKPANLLHIHAVDSSKDRPHESTQILSPLPLLGERVRVRGAEGREQRAKSNLGRFSTFLDQLS